MRLTVRVVPQSVEELQTFPRAAVVVLGDSSVGACSAGARTQQADAALTPSNLSLRSRGTRFEAIPRRTEYCLELVDWAGKRLISRQRAKVLVTQLYADGLAEEPLRLRSRSGSGHRESKNPRQASRSRWGSRYAQRWSRG